MTKTKRTDYKICPFCGSALDPMEKCDCEEALEDAGRRVNASRVYNHPRMVKKPLNRTIGAL